MHSHLDLTRSFRSLKAALHHDGLIITALLMQPAGHMHGWGGCRVAPPDPFWLACRFLKEQGRPKHRSKKLQLIGEVSGTRLLLWLDNKLMGDRWYFKRHDKADN